MLSILKNDYCRMMKRLPVFIILNIVMIASIILAVYITGTQQVKGHIVVVSSSQSVTVNSKELSIVTMKKEPPLSCLVKQQYDAYLIDRGNGRFNIKTLRSDEFKNMLKAIIKYPNMKLKPLSTDRGIGVNIIGFLMMSLLMSVFMSLFTFADDKEQNLLVRIAASPIRFGGYLAAHCVFCLSMSLPSYFTIVILKIIGFNIGFSLLQYFLLFVIIEFLGISLALLLHTILNKGDNANMLGNSIIMLTTVLAGSFYSFTKKGTFLDTIIKVLPQKQILDYASNINSGNAFSNAAHLFYAVAVCAVLFAASVVILNRKYIKK